MTKVQWQAQTYELTSTMKTATKLYLSRNISEAPQNQNPITAICISDTHNQQLELPSGDLLIHAGDLSKGGTFSEIQAQLNWLNLQEHPYKVIIGGNHDRILDPSFHGRHPRLLPEEPALGDLNWGSLIYLENSSCTLEFSNGRSLNIYGSPYVPSCGSWAFTYPPDNDIWHNAIPSDTDIVVTHGPPKWHLDATLRGEHIGCPHLLRELKRVRPQLVVCGHVHEAHGEEKLLFDGIENAWEKIMETNSSSGSLLGLGLRVHWWNVTRAGGKFAPKYTYLVNAAVVEGGMVSKGRVAYQAIAHTI